MGVGLDVGTNMLVSAIMGENGSPMYRKQRDAFYRIVPRSEVNRKIQLKALEAKNANFIIDGNDFVVVGEDALMMANERNDVSKRPMHKGVLSPKEKDSLPMMKLIIRSLLLGASENVPLVFSIPGDPIDGSFDIFFHTEMMKTYLKEMGFDPTPMNEAFAIAFAELIDDELTGTCISFGAGMVNVAVCYEGDPIVQFSMTRGGDWIDQSVANAIGETPSMVQIEKEEGDIDLTSPKNKIQQAISIYYTKLFEYVVHNVSNELTKHKLPSFRSAMPIVVSGGLTLAKNFVPVFKDGLNGASLPFDIKEVRRSKDPMTCVAHGALMASIL